MKKVLLGSSAIALATAAAAPAQAADWDVRVGGYAYARLAYVGFDGPDNALTQVDLDGVDQKFDGEIFFLPSITLDNGIKIGANVQLEMRASASTGVGTPDVIDEAYIFVDGSFGRLDLGDENSAGYKMHYAAPDVSFVGVNSPSSTIFVPYSGALGGVLMGADLFRGTLASTFIENERNNDATRITYYTPRYAGFQLGVSYARDGLQNTQAQINTAFANPVDIIDIGANYVNSFGDFDVALSARWGIASDNRTPLLVNTGDVGNDPEVMAFGANFGYAGFTIGGSFAEQNNAGAQDGQSYTAGVSYETGPWGVSATWFHGNNVDNENTFGDTGVPIGNAAITGIEEKVDNFIVAVTYSLAKGVRLGAFGGYTDFDEDTGDFQANDGGNDASGFYIGGGIAISF